MQMIFCIILGVLMGTWSFFSIGTFYVFLISAMLICLVVRMFKQHSQRKIIAGICIVAIVLRFALALLNYSFSKAASKGIDIVGDARAYSTSGQYISEVITNKPTSIYDNEPAWLFSLREIYKGKMPQGGYRVDYFARYIGLLYSVIGYDPIAIKFINSLLSLSTALLILFMLREFSSFQTACLAFVLTLFWFSILFWSITGAKDSPNIFLIIIFIFVVIKLIKHINILEFLLLSAMIVTHNFILIALLFFAIILSMILKKFAFNLKSHKNLGVPLLLIVVLKFAFNSLMAIRPHIAIPLLIAFLFYTVHGAGVYFSPS